MKNINLQPDDLVLSIDTDECTSKVVASDSKGNVTLLDVEAEQEVIKSWNAHQYEAWTTAFDKFQKNVVYSGK